MSKLNEVINSLSDENVEEVKETLLSEADVLAKDNKRLYVRAKKAEGFEYNKTQNKWIKKEVKTESKKPDAKETAEKSNEPDYARLAFLEQRGLKDPDDQKLVQDEAERLKMPLTDVLNMEHIKSKLKDSNDQREAQAGMPKGKGKPGSSGGQHDVDYWLAKGKKEDGTYHTPDDPELASKIIDARVKKEEQGNKFSDELYTG